MEQKRIAGEKAADYIKDGMILGLGTGSTAYYTILKVGEFVQSGLRLKAVATSKSTELLAKELRIPLISIDETDRIDLAIDGVDEIDSQFNAIKGGGGALFREKIVARLAREVIWIMESSKLVDSLGAVPLPVEVLPYGYTHVLRKMRDYALNPVLRMNESHLFTTDNGNYIVDLHLGKHRDFIRINTQITDITGVLETGLFMNTCRRIIVGTVSGAEVIENPRLIKI